MKTLYCCVLSMLCYKISTGQDNFYSQEYGNPGKPAIVFLHGGPGYNAFSFEFSTAQVLAENGFYVIIYDQRGCGRTKTDTNSLFTFQESFNDLNLIYNKYNLEKATLIGHSFGGTVGILFSEKFPDKVENLILVGSPLSYQMTFKNIILRCKKIYTKKNPQQLQYIEMLEKMDTNSLDYSSYCFMHAMANGFYNAKNPSKKFEIIYENLTNNSNAKYLSNFTREPVNGFFENEHYTTLNLANQLVQLKSKINVVGIYGKEDGLFDEEQIALLQSAIGIDKFVHVKNASHNVFIDQQDIFISLLQKYIKK